MESIMIDYAMGASFGQFGTQTKCRLKRHLYLRAVM